MKTVFVSELKPFLDAVAKQMELYVPKETGGHYVYRKYDPSAAEPPVLNNIRTCATVKEFLFPMCELAAVFPNPAEPLQVKPFAVFGLKDCDLRSIEILDKVFQEEEFKDPLYIERRRNMFIISSDCWEPAENCFCNMCDGQPFAEKGFDLNVSKVRDSFIIEAGSQKGEDFIEEHPKLFNKIPQNLLSERDKNRAQTQKQLEQNNAEFKLDRPIKEIVENSQDSEAFDVEAKGCVECQACTRICPTCHCFYLYDSKQQDYFTKMKMWDSCMRQAYAAVAGGENPRKVLGDRVKHRLMHKFVYFLDRYGLDMCVGCGRCVDTCAGAMDTRTLLKRLNEELKSKKEAKAAK